MQLHTGSNVVHIFLSRSQNYRCFGGRGFSSHQALNTITEAPCDGRHTDVFNVTDTPPAQAATRTPTPRLELWNQQKVTPDVA